MTSPTLRANARMAAGGSPSHYDLYRALEDAALCRGGIPITDTRSLHAGHVDVMHSVSVRYLAEEWLRSVGISPGMHPIDTAYRTSLEARQSTRNLSTDDFLGICENISGKALLMGFEQSEPIYRQIARVSTLNDFRRSVRAGMDPMEVLTPPGENGAVQSQIASSTRAYIQGRRYVGNYVITYEALLNDDLDALTRPLYQAGALAAATVDAALLAMLTSTSGTGPLLASGVALFHAGTHANYGASAGGITAANISTGRQSMRRQKDAGTTRCLNIGPKFLLVPPSLESEARVFCAAEHVPGRTDNLECVVAPQLEDGTDGTTAWYLLADPNLHDTLDVGFVGGEAPELQSEAGWEVAGQSTKIAISLGTAALDYRGMYRKRGA